MQIRLFLAFTLIILITVGSVLLLVRQNTAQEVQTFMFRGGLLGIEDLVDDLEICYQEKQDWQPCGDILDNYSNLENRPQGQMRGTRGQGMHGQSEGNINLTLISAGGTVVSSNDSNFVPGDELILPAENSIPLEANREVVGYLLTEHYPEFTNQQQELLTSRLNRSILTGALIAGAVALLLSVGTAYQFLKPVRQLTRATQKMAGGDLSQRVEIQGRAELSALGQAFNHMAQSLEKARESRKTLTADIAHELRTPLSIQQAYLEALQDGIYDLSPENLAPIQEQNTSLKHLVEDLRTLALADSGELNLEITDIEPGTFLEKIIRQFQPRADRNDLRLTLDLPDSIPAVKADPQRMEQILVNLIDNALRHSPSGEEVTVRLNVDADQVRISVQDHGTGIPEEELPHIFDRFFRGDESRFHPEGGTGLGLSISRKLAQAHGGELTARNLPAGGAEFVLFFPL